MYNAHTFGHAVEISEPWIPYFPKKLSLKIIKTLFLLNQKSRISAGWTPFSAGLVKTLAPSQNCIQQPLLLQPQRTGSTQCWPVSVGWVICQGQIKVKQLTRPHMSYACSLFSFLPNAPSSPSASQPVPLNTKLARQDKQWYVCGDRIVWRGGRKRTKGRVLFCPLGTGIHLSASPSLLDVQTSPSPRAGFLKVSAEWAWGVTWMHMETQKEGAL